MLSDFLRKNNIKTYLSQEPTFFKYGKRLRNMWKKGVRDSDLEIQLFIKDRGYHLHRRIIPKINDSFIVILDRYFFSSAAYQGALEKTDPLDILSLMRKHFPDPDVTFYLDIDVDNALERISRRNTTNNKAIEYRENLNKVATIYKNIAPDHFFTIDAVLSASNIHNTIVSELIHRGIIHRT